MIAKQVTNLGAKRPFWIHHHTFCIWDVLRLGFGHKQTQHHTAYDGNGRVNKEVIKQSAVSVHDISGDDEHECRCNIGSIEDAQVFGHSLCGRDVVRDHGVGEGEYAFDRRGKEE